MCNCIDMVNALYADKNGILETNWLSDPPRAMLSVCKKDTRSRTKPPLMEATFCPFCGEKYAKNKRELAQLGSSAT